MEANDATAENEEQPPKAPAETASDSPSKKTFEFSLGTVSVYF